MIITNTRDIPCATVFHQKWFLSFARARLLPHFKYTHRKEKKIIAMKFYRAHKSSMLLFFFRISVAPHYFSICKVKLDTWKSMHITNDRKHRPNKHGIYVRTDEKNCHTIAEREKSWNIEMNKQTDCNEKWIRIFLLKGKKLPWKL